MLVQMFTGIISNIGKILDIQSYRELEFTVGCDYDLEGISIGASIAHDGICLTVIEKGTTNWQKWYKVNVSRETVNCTKLKSSKDCWALGSLINLERSLKVVLFV